MSSINLAFAEKEPSLFIIQTPFQAMCAINAIRQLKIDDYVLSLHLHKNTEKRNKQTIELVERYGLNYHVVKGCPIGIVNRLGLISNKGKYNRVFLGTHLYQDGYYYALKELRKGGNLVLLDDGVATLTLLEKGYRVTGRSVIPMAWNKTIAAIQGIALNNVLTVYKGIYNSKWNISVNELSLLCKSNSPMEKKKIFFIGTNNSGFINKLGINEYEFKQALHNVLQNIRMLYPQEEITYIPHGRDKSLFAKSMCEEIGIDYKPLDVNVEIYILSLGFIPNAIYGFTSSALYNLKMMFPDIIVNNYVMKLLTDKSPDILSVSAYYEKQGINTIEIQ